VDFDDVKRNVLIAIASDDKLFHRLVLKGGNAIWLYRPDFERPSLDLDFSITGQFTDLELLEVQARIDRVLKRQFQSVNHEVFDLKIEQRPTEISPDLRTFWGGYRVTFKIIEITKIDLVGQDLQKMRMSSVSFGKKHNRVFSIDISAHEYCDHKQEHRIDEFSIYVYSLDAIVCEKLRAICQQHPDYSVIVHRGRPPSARARDFFDICQIAEFHPLNFGDAGIQQLLVAIFEAKRVPLHLLGEIGVARDFHREDFLSVRDTSGGSPRKSFDDYVDQVVGLLEPAKLLWHK